MGYFISSCWLPTRVFTCRGAGGAKHVIAEVRCGEMQGGQAGTKYGGAIFVRGGTFCQKSLTNNR